MDSHFLRVKYWNTLYENSRSRVIERARWVSIPNKHDGDGFAQIMEQKNALELFAIWIFILQIASKCKKRGDLIDNGVPILAKQIIRKTRTKPAKLKTVEEFIEFLVSQVKWLEWVKCKNVDELPLEYPPSTVEGKGREGNRRESDTVVSESPDSKTLSPSKRIVFNGSEIKGIIDEDFKRWAEAYPACDIKAEIASALDWLISNPVKAKKSNYARFITAWLKRSQDRGGSASSTQKIQRTRPGYIPASGNQNNDYGSKVIKGS